MRVIPRPTWTQALRCENTFAFGYCFDFKVVSGTRIARQQTRQMSQNLKVSTDLAYCKFYLTIQCNCSACAVLPDAVLQKRVNFFTLVIGHYNLFSGLSCSIELVIDFLRYIMSQTVRTDLASAAFVPKQMSGKVTRSKPN
jgi:hypothetical protein